MEEAKPGAQFDSGRERLGRALKSHLRCHPSGKGLRNPVRLICLLLFLFISGASSALAASAQLSQGDPRRDPVVEAVQKVMPAVVNIRTEEIVQIRDPLEDIFQEFFGPYYRRRPPNTQYSLGSGVIIDEEGVVLTNFHVVNRARRVCVKLFDGREFECEKLAGTRFVDIALLKIRLQGRRKIHRRQVRGR